MVEPIDPFEGPIFDGLERLARATPVDHLGISRLQNLRVRRRLDDYRARLGIEALAEHAEKMPN